MQTWSIRVAALLAVAVAVTLIGFTVATKPMQQARVDVTAQAREMPPLDDPNLEVDVDTDANEADDDDTAALLQQEEDDDSQRQQQEDDAQAQRALDQATQDMVEAQQQAEQQNEAAQQQMQLDEQLASQ
ncbi:MAG: hypothetical protein WCE30_17555 [Mycobacterium sp.]